MTDLELPCTAVYSIWKSSISLPTLVTNDMVLSKLVEGADLFAPGISRQSIATLSDDLPEGSIVGIGTTSVPNAIRGIGRLYMHSKNLGENPQGKAVEILHVEGDSLWALGDKSTAQPREVPQDGKHDEVDLPVGYEEPTGEVTEIEATDSTNEVGTVATKAELSTSGVLYKTDECFLRNTDLVLFRARCGRFPQGSSYLRNRSNLPKTA